MDLKMIAYPIHADEYTIDVGYYKSVNTCSLITDVRNLVPNTSILNDMVMKLSTVLLWRKYKDVIFALKRTLRSV